MDTKKLRQKILDLAIHGKLVPQDPNDEPASVLLERIRAEKERLIAEGKIKRSKKSSTSDTPHYENVPFEVPDGWCWVKMDDYVFGVTDGDHQPPPQANEGVPFLVISDVNTGKICFDKSRFVEESYFCSLPDSRKASKGDLLFTVTGSYGIVIPVETEREFCFQRHIGLIKVIADSSWLRYVLMSRYVQAYCNKVATGTAQKTVGLAMLRELLIPIPPLPEQQRINSVIEQCMLLVDDVKTSTIELKDRIVKAKNRILDLAIHGKLVPQDASDEPAAELLKRINPKAVASCDNPHYEQIPDGWCFCTLEDIVDYEQPQAYIVHSTDYSDSYKIPVLTAGKSFVIGYTNEQDGICNNIPVIIFDDFTTDSKYVDFPFKVKSSAMKILHVKDGINIKYVAYFMSITRLIGDTHKRYWISEYSKVTIPLPPKAEQDRIVNQIEGLMCSLDSIAETLV